MTGPSIPGLHPARLARHVRRAIADCDLDLTGLVVLTEAGTGAYRITPAIAATAGASRVIALTRDTAYGRASDVVRETAELASELGVADRIDIRTDRTAEAFGLADIVTNSGHVRPLDTQTAAWIRPDAVVSLMFEAWELDAARGDLDLEALRARGVRLAGTNERHPHVDVFSFLGQKAVQQLIDAGVGARHSHVLVVCDNPFATYLVDGLRAAGTNVSLADRPPASFDPNLDAVLVALRPTGGPVFGGAEATGLTRAAPGAVLLQYWGDVDRRACAEVGLACWPPEAPGSGHMGILPSAVGPEPILRLQTGGLKVGQVLLTDPADRTNADREYLDEL
ncbi:MAG TPA: hypothetical protein VFF40_02310 [Acidimicrobiia bacterium]|nr:hypothetical protein [Acidimicrobiia bacterium]